MFRKNLGKIHLLVNQREIGGYCYFLKETVMLPVIFLILMLLLSIVVLVMSFTNVLDKNKNDVRGG